MLAGDGTCRRRSCASDSQLYKRYLTAQDWANQDTLLRCNEKLFGWSKINDRCLQIKQGVDVKIAFELVVSQGPRGDRIVSLLTRRELTRRELTRRELARRDRCLRIKEQVLKSRLNW